MTSNIAFRYSVANLHMEGASKANNVADVRGDEATIAQGCTMLLEKPLLIPGLFSKHGSRWVASSCKPLVALRERIA
jgi:hypothetical protein